MPGPPQARLFDLHAGPACTVQQQNQPLVRNRLRDLRKTDAPLFDRGHSQRQIKQCIGGPRQRQAQRLDRRHRPPVRAVARRAGLAVDDRSCVLGCHDARCPSVAPS